MYFHPVKTKFYKPVNFVNTDKVSRKKSHACEEGGIHLRISFLHLLMDLKKQIFIKKNCWSDQ